MPRMSTHTPPDAAELLRAAADLALVARTHAEEIERERRLPDALVESLRDAGLFHMWVPRDLGGSELDPLTFMQAVEVLSRGDASAGWVVMIAAETAGLAGVMPASAAERIFAGGRPICVGTLNPAAGTMRREGDGFRASGQWPFGSGIPHADWVLSRCRLLDDGGEPILDERGQPRASVVAVPVAEVRIVDTWAVSGLRGTGSHDYALDEVAVPERLVFGFDGGPADRGALYRYPLRARFQIGHAAHALGTFAQATEAFRSLVSTSAREQRSSGERALLHDRRGEAEALAGAAGAWVRELVAETWAQTVAEADVPAESWALLTLAVAHAVRSCVRAVDLLYEAAGAQSLFQQHALERSWRDMRAAGQHLHAKREHYADAGRLLFDQP